ncbi:MAG: hypothetical protein KZQ63_01200 [Candidatus Thiodiazotropha sp. (ex Lucinoma aequizonata)]|nr:hypothetical protein [Candidatus Thiodiazotropha sp. (ex Lucinoma aequizonata)]
MEVQTNHLTEKKKQDADQDYPQSGSEIQIICVRNGTIAKRCSGTDTGN